MRIAVLGASGYVGSRLVARLVDDGDEVVAIARHVDSVPAHERVHPVAVDLADRAALEQALQGCAAAYYLVHSMAGGEGFAERDRQLAATAAGAAAAAGVGRIVYLGGLGADELSTHLTSRHDTGAALREAGVPVVELRAAVVLGSGSISFEMVRYLTERLPVMVCPRWIRTRVQPIAERDLLTYLVQARTVAPGTYEIGGPEVTTYREMIATYAAVRGLPKRTIVDIPLLTPSLSAHWVDLVTPVDRAVSHALIESLTAEVVVRTPTDAFDVEGMSIADAIRAALDDQAERIPAQLFSLSEGLCDGVYVMHSHADVAPEHLEGAEADVDSCGGDLRWYGLAWAWWLRIRLGRLFGEHLELHRPAVVEVGAQVDWWTVARLEPALLVLSTREWAFGEAWLGYAVHRTPSPRVDQVGAFRPLGLRGTIYWRLLWPIHVVVFRLMARRQATRAWQQTEALSRRGRRGRARRAVRA